MGTDDAAIMGHNFSARCFAGKDVVLNWRDRHGETPFNGDVKIGEMDSAKSILTQVIKANEERATFCIEHENAYCFTKPEAPACFSVALSNPSPSRTPLEGKKKLARGVPGERQVVSAMATKSYCIYRR